jgi:glycerate-2-kinase
VLERYGVWRRAPAAVRRVLAAGADGHLPETPKPGDPAFRRAAYRVIGSGALAAAAAVREARRLGFATELLTTRLHGEARAAGRRLAGVLARRAARARRPLALVAAGETTVTVTGDGRGGRNQELCLGAAERLHGLGFPAAVASLGTDGIDGMSPAAGAVVDDTTVARGRELGLAPLRDFLASNDSYAYLASVGDLIVSGPTGTNVGDLVVLLASPARKR